MPKVIVFFSTKGGVGTTTISFNTAVNLSLQKKKVLFLSLNLDAPLDAARMHKVRLRKSMAEMINTGDKRKNDKEFVKKTYLTPINPYLDFQVAVTSLSVLSYLNAEGVEKALTFFKEVGYDFIIIDGGKNITDILIKVFDNANLILFTATPDILSLYHTKWIVDTLQSLGFPIVMMKAVLNRSQSSGSVSNPEVKMILPIEILSLIPSDGKVVAFALNKRIPVVLDNPNSRICTAINSLVKMLCGNESIYISHKELSDLRIKKGGVILQRAKSDIWTSLGLTEPLNEEINAQEKDPLIDLKNRVHKSLIENMNLRSISLGTMDAEQKKLLRRKTEDLLVNILAKEAEGIISSREVREAMIKEIADEALGLGPLEDLLRDNEITEIMVNNKDQIYIEKNGKIKIVNKHFTSNTQIRVIIERILAPLGRRIDESCPYVDARLPDGSRVNAIIPPLSLTGPTLTIRKFDKQVLRIEELVTRLGSMTEEIAGFLQACVLGKKNILVSGGTGSGKTTLLNILSEFICDEERIITIEDSAELRLHHRHWVRLESRPANIEGRGEVTIKELFRNSLRMRPDRIIVGECRGIEILDMFQAMNTGHDGSMTTIHANSTQDALIRLDSMVLMSGIELPVRAIREMVSSAIHLIVHTVRFSDGSRKVVQITEFAGMLDETRIDLKDIFIFKQTGMDDKGKILGAFVPTGYIPTFYEKLRAEGIDLPREIFVPKE